jgi:hypothetical protein
VSLAGLNVTGVILECPVDGCAWFVHKRVAIPALARDQLVIANQRLAAHLAAVHGAVDSEPIREEDFRE